jgi:ferredoxin-NADP reductase
MDQRPGDVTLVYRARSDADQIFVDELTALAESRRARFFVVSGTRATGRSSWLPQHAAHMGDVEAELMDQAGDHRDARHYLLASQRDGLITL